MLWTSSLGKMHEIPRQSGEMEKRTRVKHHSNGLGFTLLYYALQVIRDTGSKTKIPKHKPGNIIHLKGMLQDFHSQARIATS